MPPLRPVEEDVRLGRLLRTLRRRASLTQTELAMLAGVPRNSLSLIETGRAGEVSVARVRRSFAAAGGRARFTVWWNGDAVDRLLDERHAAIVELIVAVLRKRGWDVRVEVSFSDYGERGSIDVLAAHLEMRAVGVFEIKSDIGSLEATNRVLDAKVRLAPKLAVAQFGWRPSHVGRVLVLPRDMTLRRIVDRHAATMQTLYPADSRQVRAWLRRPSQPIAAIWFVTDA